MHLSFIVETASVWCVSVSVTNDHSHSDIIPLGTEAASFDTHLVHIQSGYTNFVRARTLNYILLGGLGRPIKAFSVPIRGYSSYICMGILSTR